MNTNYLKIVLFAALSFAFTAVTHAAPISVGSILLDSDNFATSASLSSSTTGTSANITDNLLSTYVRGSDTSSSVTLSFNSNISNGNGADLALFFIDVANFSLSIGSQTVNYSSTQLYDPNNKAFGVNIGGNVFSLTAAQIDLNDFGFTSADILGDITVNLGSRQTILSLASGINVSPVPLPGAFFLFLSGLAGFGLLSRRKR
jgi:hypothetical protein